MNRIAAVVLGAMLLAACGDDRPLPETTVFDDQVKALKKAEQVGDRVQETTDALKRAAEAAGVQPAPDR